MTALPLAEHHRTLATQFSTLLARAEETSAWSSPTPVREWDVRALGTHLVWFHDFVHAGSPFGWTRRVDPDSDPRAAFDEQSAAVQLVLDDPAQSESPFSHPHLRPTTLGDAAARFYVADLFMHTWDLARSLGEEVELDEEYAADLLAGMVLMEDVIRSSGQYGPAHPVADDAPLLERLMAFVGRDPDWRRPA